VQPKENDELTSSARRIFALALPVGLETVFQTSLGAVDQVIVAILGADAIAGVGLSNTVTFIVMLVYSAVGTGSGVLIAQAFGRIDMKEVSRDYGLRTDSRRIVRPLHRLTARPFSERHSSLDRCAGDGRECDRRILSIVRGLRTTGREQRRKHGNIPFTQ
jgi:hypothetical protein